MQLQGTRSERVTISCGFKDALLAVAEEIGVANAVPHIGMPAIQENRTKGGKLKSIEYQRDISYHGRPQYETYATIDDPERLEAWDAIKTILAYHNKIHKKDEE